MTPQEHSLPLSGFTIVKIHMTKAELTPKEPNPNATEPIVQFGWGWRRGHTDRSLFEVRITLAMEPAKERPYFAAVDAVGRFQQVGDTSGLQIEEFAGLQAVAILMPYARQHLSDLTVNTLAGPYYLPSLNVVELMRGFKVRKETIEKKRGSSKRVSVKKR